MASRFGFWASTCCLVVLSLGLGCNQRYDGYSVQAQPDGNQAAAGQTGQDPLGTTTPGTTNPGTSNPGTTTPGTTNPGTTAPVPSASGFGVAAWLPHWGSGPYDSLDAHHASMTEVMPTWYRIQADGSIKLGRGRSASFVAEQHQRGLQVLPMVDDFISGGAGPIVRSASKRARAIAELVAEVDALQLDGLDIDFEGMKERDRDNFVRFLIGLRDALHARGKLLSVAVYGKRAEPGHWSGPKSHDYKAIGNVVDRFRIMNYGWGGPISPMWWTDDVLDFAKTQVPAAKIQLGVAFFGKDKGDDGSKKSYTTTQALAVAQSYGAQISHDTASGEAHFTYTKNGVHHSVYFQDEVSMATKCAAALRHGIAGIAIWRLGGETHAMWQSIDATVHGGGGAGR